MTSIEKKIASNYWRNKIKDLPMVNDQSLQLSETSRLEIAKEELAYFKKLTNENSIAEFTILLSIFNILIQRYFNPNHAVLLSGMKQAEKALLYKLIPIKDNTFKEYLNQLKQEVQANYKHSDFNPLAFKDPLENYATFGFSYNAKNQFQKSTLPFTLAIQKKDQRLIVSIFYDEKFAENYVAHHFLENFKNYLLKLKSFLNEKLNQLPIVSTVEKNQLLESFNRTTTTDRKDETLIDLFEKQVINTPEAIALEYKGGLLTYKELNEQANQLAAYLANHHQIVQNDFVGIKLARSEKLLLAILGVLKLEATYVPLDVNYPAERISYIEKDSNCKCCIDEEVYRRFAKSKAEYSKVNRLMDRKAERIAYIIYTSGTTGNPKGVMISHQNAVAMVYWAWETYNSANFEVTYAATSHCFDLSIYEMFYTLSIGKRLKILNSSLEIGAALPKDRKVLLNLVPSSIRNILENGHSLENVSIINLAGEPFPVDIAKKLLLVVPEVRNLYGPSEDTTYSTCYRLSAQKNYDAIPIGKPITNTRAYVLDEELQLVPLGVVGKLYLSGAGIAQGYLNRPKLTAEKFIENPFVQGERMYDTGDLAKWMLDGNLAFLGRKDHQVKLRGYRIELGEIENAVLSYSDHISEVVVAIKSYKEKPALVAYYVENISIDRSNLRSFLAAQLPAYMIPEYFIRVEKIPLTPNGKVDKNSLPQIDTASLVKRDYVAPLDAIEKALVDIWEQVLDVSPIGVNDHFFDLGGHSLMITQIINAVYKKLQKSLSYKAFFKNPTIKDLRNALEKRIFHPILKALN